MIKYKLINLSKLYNLFCERYDLLNNNYSKNKIESLYFYFYIS